MDQVKRQLLAVIDEALKGPPERFAYFSDRGRPAGLIEILQSIDAASASRIVGTTSIASHVNHLAFAADASARFVDGNTTRVAWEDSWAVSSVDAKDWSQLIEDLSNAVSRSKIAIESGFAQSERSIGTALGAAAHLAYHLGAIRQKLRVPEDRDT